MMDKIWAECRKSLRFWFRSRVLSMVALLPPLLLTFVFVRAFTIAGDGFSMVVVDQDDSGRSGAWGNRLMGSLVSQKGTLPYFKVLVKSEKEALAMFRKRETYMVVKIPKGFHASIVKGKPMALPVMINTIHEDLSKNLRLGLEARLYHFMVDYQLKAPQRPGVDIKAELLQPKELPRPDYMMVGIVIWTIVFLSFFSGGALAAMEKDQGNFIEVAMSPYGPLASSLGKTITAMLIASLMLALLLLMNVFLYGMHFPSLTSVWHLTLVVLCLSFTFSFAGVQYGLAVGDFRAVPAPSILLSFALWMISGAINPLEFAAGSQFFEMLPTAAAIRVMMPSMFGRGEAVAAGAWWVLWGWAIATFVVMAALIAKAFLRRQGEAKK